MNNKLKLQVYDQERALYNLQNTDVIECRFAGEADGESPLKEARNINVINSDFSLRYPLWHIENFSIKESRFDELSRASIWYAKNGKISGSTVNSIKCLRNCWNILVIDSEIHSEEAGWFSEDIKVKNTKIYGDYQFLHAKNIEIKKSILDGKYGFQYMKNVHIKDSKLNTKDAFWHSEDVIIEDSLVNGAYLGWYSKNLTLINCKITGTQPFCYCENLKLVNCTMDDCDLAFEYSSVDAAIEGHILSVKNPKSGHIIADSIGEVILSESIISNQALIETRESK